MIAFAPTLGDLGYVGDGGLGLGDVAPDAPLSPNAKATIGVGALIAALALWALIFYGLSRK